MHTASQRRLQADLDKDGFSADPSHWDYERDIPKLFGGMVVSTRFNIGTGVEGASTLTDFT